MKSSPTYSYDTDDSTAILQGADWRDGFACFGAADCGKAAAEDRSDWISLRLAQGR